MRARSLVATIAAGVVLAAGTAVGTLSAHAEDTPSAQRAAAAPAAKDSTEQGATAGDEVTTQADWFSDAAKSCRVWSQRRWPFNRDGGGLHRIAGPIGALLGGRFLFGGIPVPGNSTVVEYAMRDTASGHWNRTDAANFMRERGRIEFGRDVILRGTGNPPVNNTIYGTFWIGGNRVGFVTANYNGTCVITRGANG